MNESYIQILSSLAASQNGLFTTAQADKFNVPRDAVSYLARANKLDRVTHGVYRFKGAPIDIFESIRATWMSTDPKALSYERLRHWDGIVIGGRSAAAIHGIGDFFISPFRFYTQNRINSKKSDAIFSVRNIDREDVETIEGLPVTNIERTLFDLYKDNEDPSLLSTAITEAMHAKHNLNFKRLEKIFNRDASTLRGLPYNSLNHMLNDAGISLFAVREDTSFGDIQNKKDLAKKVVLVSTDGTLISLDTLFPNSSKGGND